MNTDSFWPNGFPIPLFMIELLLRERNFGHTHTQLLVEWNGLAWSIQLQILFSHPFFYVIPIPRHTYTQKTKKRQ